MYLMYVDESGDVGLSSSPTQYFILSAIVIHELRWKPALQSLVDFRRYLRDPERIKAQGRNSLHGFYK